MIGMQNRQNSSGHMRMTIDDRYTYQRTIYGQRTRREGNKDTKPYMQLQSSVSQDVVPQNTQYLQATALTA